MSEPPINRSRRGFFTGSLLTREGRQQIDQAVKRLGLIPPDLKSVLLTDNCVNCNGNCSLICPQKIIKRHPNNHQIAGQPYLDFSENGCTFCHQCHTACPHTTDQEAMQNNLGKAHINHQQCYAWLDIICMSCISICPAQLIKFNHSRKPSVQQDNCTGCGICIKVCPATAISIHSLTASQA